MNNRVATQLIELGVCFPESIRPFFPRVRDREDVQVMRCDKSGVILLSRSDHISDDHYHEKEGLSYWSAKTREEALLACRDDDSRRARQFQSVISGKRWLDYGTGAGGIIDILGPFATEVCAVEHQRPIARMLKELGYQVHEDILDVPLRRFEIVSMFHVLEHLVDPVLTLRQLRETMAPRSRIVIEVPHARDALITQYDCAAFKAFTFWSEHLVLHTRNSLQIVLEAAGFVDINVWSVQRYPLANHLFWLCHGRPGGHKEWSFLSDSKLGDAYADTLARMDINDTLLATAVSGDEG